MELLDEERKPVTLWEVDIYPADGQPDPAAEAVAASAADLGLASSCPFMPPAAICSKAS